MTTHDRGAALIIAIMAMLLLMALGLMLVLNTAAETLIAAHFRTGQEAFYAADAALERVTAELDRMADWSGALSGARRSAFVDGPPSGARTLSDGTTIDLGSQTNLLNCGHAAACAQGELGPSPWTLYASAPLSAMVPTGTINSNMYVAAWVSDAASDPGGAMLNVRAEAFGPGGTHRAVEATLRRAEGEVRVIGWRSVSGELGN
jgi:Tfp pilus assembly protein PilX